MKYIDEMMIGDQALEAALTSCVNLDEARIEAMRDRYYPQANLLAFLPAGQAATPHLIRLFKKG